MQQSVKRFGVEGTFIDRDFLEKCSAVICAVEKTDKFAGDRAVDFQGGVAGGRDHVRECGVVAREWSGDRAFRDFGDEMRRPGVQINESDFVATEEKGKQASRVLPDGHQSGQVGGDRKFAD